MALNLGIIDFIIKELLPRLRSRGWVLSLSRQRLSCPPDELREYIHRLGLTLPQPRNDSRPTSKELFQALGFRRYDDLDINPDEATVLHDMNEPVPEQYRGRYDLVFELGTIEHIFDIKNVFSNIIKMLKVGGAVCHLAPLNLINHGFYNFSPTLFYDVYRTNGFKDITLYKADHPFRWWKNQNFMYERIEFVPGRLKIKSPQGYFPMVGCIAVKDRDSGVFNSPRQAIYDQELGLTPVF